MFSNRTGSFRNGLQRKELSISLDVGPQGLFRFDMIYYLIDNGESYMCLFVVNNLDSY